MYISMVISLSQNCKSFKSINMLCRDPYDCSYANRCNFTLNWYHLEWSITNVRNVIRETPIFSFMAVYWLKDSSDWYLHRQKGIYYVAPMYTYLMRFYVRRMLTEVWNHQLNIKCKMFISSLKYWFDIYWWKVSSIEQLN